MELFKASNQWATRPSDERFWDVPEMLQSCEAYKASSQEAQVKYSDLRFEADGREIFITGKARTQARLSHWAFGQVCQKVGAPASYLRTLPATEKHHWKHYWTTILPVRHARAPRPTI